MRMWLQDDPTEPEGVYVKVNVSSHRAARDVNINSVDRDARVGISISNAEIAFCGDEITISGYVHEDGMDDHQYVLRTYALRFLPPKKSEKR